MKNLKRCILIIIVIALVASIVALCVNLVFSKVNNKANPTVTMEVEGYGVIKIELYPDKAPNTVKNFIKLAQRGYYDGKTFNDIEDGLIRAGLTETTGEDGTVIEEGPKLSNLKDLPEGENDKSYSTKGEFIENGFDNTLSHQKGVISMYRTTSGKYQQEISMVELMGYSDYVDTLIKEMYNSQSGGFFIVTEDSPQYDGLFTAFGKVTEGMDVVDAISNTEVKKETGENGEETETTSPVNPPVITKVTVDTHGVDYGMPETADTFDFDAIFNMFMQNYMQSSSQTTSY